MSSVQSAERVKRCPRCNKLHPLGAFGPNKSSKDGLQVYCKECNRAQVAENREKAKLVKKLSQELESTEYENSDEKIVAYFKAGFLPADIANKVQGYSPQLVVEVIARRQMEELAPDTREFRRQIALVHMDLLIAEAMGKGDLKEARLAIMDQLRAIGIIQQGGQTMNFQFNTQNNLLESRMEKWMDSQDTTKVKQKKLKAS